MKMALEMTTQRAHPKRVTDQVQAVSPRRGANLQKQHAYYLDGAHISLLVFSRKAFGPLGVARGRFWMFFGPILVRNLHKMEQTTIDECSTN